MVRLLRQLTLLLAGMVASLFIGWLLREQIERERERQAEVGAESAPRLAPTPAPRLRPREQTEAERPGASPATAGSTTSVAPASSDESAESTERKRAAKPPTRTRRRDDLTIIEGIGPAYARALNSLGITTFADLAKQDPDDLAQRMPTRVTAARIRQDDWIGQAKQLSQG
jgi:predicted flap endonuclease-1-like 5' DNA nuclease